MKEMLKNAGILFAITLIAGLLLGLVNEITKTPIADQQVKAKAKAQQIVFAADEENGIVGANSFEVAWFDAEKCDSILTMAGYGQESIDEISKAYDASGELLGYVLTVTTKEGYAGDISFTMGIRLDGTLNGIYLTSINETPGLGMNANKVLVPQFAGKKVEAFTYSKVGSKSPDEVDAISSATYTTSAIVNGVNSGLVIFGQVEEVIR